MRFFSTPLFLHPPKIPPISGWKDEALVPAGKDKRIYMCDRVDQLPLFSYGRDGHQPYSRVLYTNYKGFPIEGGMTIPNARSLDPGTYKNIIYTRFGGFIQIFSSLFRSLGVIDDPI